MNSPVSTISKLQIRPFQYRDLEAIETLVKISVDETEQPSCSMMLAQQLEQVRSHYGLLKFLSLFPNPCQHDFHVYVAEKEQQIVGLIKVSPFNINRSTWRVEKVIISNNLSEPELVSGNKSIGSQLLRYCFETIWEARTWLLEVNIHEKSTLALYRQNGFQPLAQITYWAIASQLLQQLATDNPDLPNLLPVSNADAYLLYQLDTVSMPPLLRQVFDRHLSDFKTNFLKAIMLKLQQWLRNREVAKGYVFEPQRKAAIGYFYLDLSRDGSRSHKAQLTVHPAYTWLYPELLAQMAHITQNFPPQSLQLTSADYQPEREEYLEKLGADRIEHTLLMSRSVWHKLREAKPLESLQLSEMLQGLQPAPPPIPSRISWLKSGKHQEITEPQSKPMLQEENQPGETANPPGNGHHA